MYLIILIFIIWLLFISKSYYKPKYMYGGAEISFNTPNNSSFGLIYVADKIIYVDDSYSLNKIGMYDDRNFNFANSYM